MIQDKDKEIDQLQKRIIEISGEIETERKARETSSSRRKQIVRNIFYVVSMVIISSPFLYLLADQFMDYSKAPSDNSLLRLVAVALVNGLGAFALFFITPWRRRVRSFSDRVANRYFIY